VETCLCAPIMPSWCGHGWLYLLGRSNSWLGHSCPSVTVLLPLTDFHVVSRAECCTNIRLHQHLSIFVITGRTDRQTDTSQEGLCTVMISRRDVCNRYCVLREQRAEAQETVEREDFRCDLL